MLGCAGVCAAVVGADGQLGQLFILPVMCLLTGFALSGTRVLVSVNAELSEAREELARNAVAEERLRSRVSRCVRRDFDVVGLSGAGEHDVELVERCFQL